MYQQIIEVTQCLITQTCQIPSSVNQSRDDLVNCGLSKQEVIASCAACTSIQNARALLFFFFVSSFFFVIAGRCRKRRRTRRVRALCARSHLSYRDDSSAGRISNSVKVCDNAREFFPFFRDRTTYITANGGFLPCNSYVPVSRNIVTIPQNGQERSIPKLNEEWVIGCRCFRLGSKRESNSGTQFSSAET